MLTLGQLEGLKVFTPRPEKRRQKVDGTPAPPKRLGKVHHVVFSPEGTRVIGVLVKRPDVAGMVKREDTFVALDCLSTFEGGLIVQGEAAMDEAAAKRLGVDLDRSIIWGGMDVVDEQGADLGYVTDISFDFDTGDLETLYVADGPLAASLVGSMPVGAEHLRGYAKGKLVVANAVHDLQLSGGLAAKAGEAAGHAQVKGRELASKAGKAADEALDKGGHALGRALGHARNSIRDAMADEEEKPSAPAGKALDVKVEAPKPPKAMAGTQNGAEPPLYVPASEAAASKGGGPASAEKDAAIPAGKGSSSPKRKREEDEGPSLPKNVDDAARAVGRQLGKTRGMFSSFLKEFEENSK